MTTTAAYGSIPTVDTSATKFASSSKSAAELQTDFLKLLTAQLQYQDPMEPEKNTDFTTQMAQFTGLSEQQKSNELLQKLITSQNVNQMNQAVSYIGKVAVVSGDGMSMNGGVGKVRFEMPQSGAATISLFDETGQQVKSYSPQSFDGGSQEFVVQDAALANGNYKFAVSMTGADGKAVAVPTLESGVVKAVINDSTGVILEMNGRKVNLADVRQVEQG
ncbi:MAG: hypothetical protein HQL95_07960 [Magnetococcales bacterium]|nr:hypothetical protein [Magnetococcales bacterium]